MVWQIRVGTGWMSPIISGLSQSNIYNTMHDIKEVKYVRIALIHLDQYFCV